MNDIWNYLAILTIAIHKYISNSLTKKFPIHLYNIAIFEELHSVYAQPIHNSPVVEQTRQNRYFQSIDKVFGMTDQSLYQIKATNWLGKLCIFIVNNIVPDYVKCLFHWPMIYVELSCISCVETSDWCL